MFSGNEVNNVSAISASQVESEESSLLMTFAEKNTPATYENILTFLSELPPIELEQESPTKKYNLNSQAISKYLSLIESKQFYLANEMLVSDDNHFLQQEICGLSQTDAKNLLTRVFSVCCNGNDYYLKNLLRVINESQVIIDVLSTIDEHKNKKNKKIKQLLLNRLKVLDGFVPEKIKQNPPHIAEYISLLKEKKFNEANEKLTKQDLQHEIESLDEQGMIELLINTIQTSSHGNEFYLKNLIQFMNNRDVIIAILPKFSWGEYKKEKNIMAMLETYLKLTENNEMPRKRKAENLAEGGLNKKTHHEIEITPVTTSIYSHSTRFFKSDEASNDADENNFLRHAHINY